MSLKRTLAWRAGSALNEKRGSEHMKRQGRHEIDMCNGPLASKILLFALPLMASTMLQLLFNAADVVVVGRFAGQEDHHRC